MVAFWSSISHVNGTPLIEIVSWKPYFKTRKKITAIIRMWMQDFANWLISTLTASIIMKATNASQSMKLPDAIREGLIKVAVWMYIAILVYGNLSLVNVRDLTLLSIWRVVIWSLSLSMLFHVHRWSITMKYAFTMAHHARWLNRLNWLDAIWMDWI